MAANRDEILLERLQKTIDTWNTEVTSAQESLARQIGDARGQLQTLIGVLNRRPRPGAAGNGDAVALRGHALAERDAALNDALERGRGLEATLRRIETERGAAQRESTQAREEMGELRGQIAAYQAQEHESAALLERAEKELAAMRRSVEATATARHTASEEVQRLREAADISAREREAFEAEALRLRAQLEERAPITRKLESEVDSLAAIIDSLRRERETVRAIAPEQLAEREAALAAAKLAIEEQEQRLAAGRAERARLHDRLAVVEGELETLVARGREREIALDRAAREAEALRRTEQDREPIEAALRAEVEALRATLEGQRSSGEDVAADLTMLNAEYDRQSLRLGETMRELEAHWEIERQGKERERQLQNSLGEAQRLHLDANAELAQLRERVAFAESATIAGPAAARPEDEVEGLREELLTIEQILIEREGAVEAAAERMRRLEETAVRVQAEVAEMHARQSANAAAAVDADALASARSENVRLRVRATDLERINMDQAERVLTLEGQVRQLRRELDAPREAASRREAAVAESRSGFVSSAPAPMTLVTPAYAFSSHTSAGQKKSMGEILVEAGIISGQQLESALEEQRSAKKRRLGSILVEKGLIRKEMVAQVVAAQLKLPFVRLSDTPIQRGAVALLDGRLATHHMCFPIAATTEEVTVAMANPLDLIAVEDLEFATHLRVKPVVATLSDITSAIVEFYGVSIANAIAEDTFDVQSPIRRPQPREAGF